MVFSPQTIEKVHFGIIKGKFLLAKSAINH